MKITQNKNLQLFLISVLMLFLELFLIRWISTEIRIFAYISNLVLLACFIGIGLGCYFSGNKSNILLSFLLILVLLIIVNLSAFRNITELLSGFSDMYIWYSALNSKIIIPAITGIILTSIIFFIIVLIFIPLGQILGNLFDSHNNTILAYSINISGSIIGVWLFSLVSFLYIPPIGWLILSVLLGFIFISKNRKQVLLFIAIVTIYFSLFLKFYSNANTIWTPYQKLDIVENYIHKNIKDGYIVNVNNVSYMGLLDISDNFLEKHINLINKDLQDFIGFNQYELPYMFKDAIKNVLIVGAGGGNDVSGALRQNVAKIDAVEIDPGIYKTGYKLHPESPYKDERVNVIINDARAFLKKSKKKYDVVSFGLLDSHTSITNYNNIRLDHYVYTKESFKEAKKLLKKDGILSLTFASNRAWISQRLYNMLKNAFNKEPLILGIPHSKILGWGGLMFITSNSENNLLDNIRNNQELFDYINLIKIKHKNIKTKTPSDDWPYLYLKNPAIPKIYISVIISILFILLLSWRFLFLRNNKINNHFFYLGSAFLLLEFQNISKSSLLFGSTWIVNSYIISAILLLILLANLTMYMLKPKKIKWAYYLLFLCILVLYFIPLNIFNSFNSLIKCILISILLNLPIYFAGLIFIYSFNKTESKNVALGSNLLGACIGGVMETLSFVFGIKALLILVLIFYILSFIYKDVI